MGIQMGYFWLHGRLDPDTQMLFLQFLGLLVSAGLHSADCLDSRSEQLLYLSLRVIYSYLGYIPTLENTNTKMQM